MKRGSSVHLSTPPAKKRRLNDDPVAEQLGSGKFRSGEVVYSDDEFSFEFLYNDEREDNLIALCDLKQIFSQCLPRMGTRYVTRHVFDCHHRLLCCRLRSSGIIIGGICIRPFYSFHFAEVVFLAVHNQYQHKSVGRRIMRVMKDVSIREDLNHFYTYADNRAIGFFTKMGFQRKKARSSNYNSISSSASYSSEYSFWDYIKHYTGSELMECKLYKNCDYIHLDNNLLKIEQNILKQTKLFRIQNNSNKNIIHEPIKAFCIPINHVIDILNLDLLCKDNDDLLLNTFTSYGIQTDRDLYDIYKYNKLNGKQLVLSDILAAFDIKLYNTIVSYLNKPNNELVVNHIDNLDNITGINPLIMRESSSSAQSININNRRSFRFDPIRIRTSWIIKRLKQHCDAYPFNEPVPSDIDGYYERIKYPMDLQTIHNKIQSNKYLNFKQFDNDFKLIISNCKEFNEPNSEIVNMSNRLNDHYQQLLIKHNRLKNNNKK